MHAKKQKNVTHNEKKTQATGEDPKMTQITIRRQGH